MADTPLFEFTDVSVEVDGTRLLDGIDLSVPDRGSLTMIVGPSGSGKSTLLRLCNRLEIASGGRLSFRGRSIDDIDPLQLRRRVGMVFQRPTVLPGTVRDNFRVAHDDATTDEMTALLDQVRLSADLLDRSGDRLSGGEAQRVCLARTLLTKPEVLLMDEPTSALDVRSARAIQDLGTELAAEGLPILWVTHDTDQARELGDRIVIVVDGRIGDVHDREHFLDGDDFDHHHDTGAETGTGTARGETDDA